MKAYYTSHEVYWRSFFFSPASHFFPRYPDAQPILETIQWTACWIYMFNGILNVKTTVKPRGKCIMVVNNYTEDSVSGRNSDLIKNSLIGSKDPCKLATLQRWLIFSPSPYKAEDHQCYKGLGACNQMVCNFWIFNDFWYSDVATLPFCTPSVWRRLWYLGWTPMSLNKPTKKKVGEVSGSGWTKLQCQCNNYFTCRDRWRSSLVRSGEGQVKDAAI